MMQASLSNEPLQKIIVKCKEESVTKFISNPSYCFELFRRAFDDLNQESWQAIQLQYKNLIYKWLYQSIKFGVTAEEIEDLYQDVLLKFWTTLQKRAKPISAHFEHVGGVLKYLNRCVVTACIDRKRMLSQIENLEASLINEKMSQSADSQIFFDSQSDRDAKIERVRLWVNSNLTDYQERLVFELSFGQGLTPKKICKNYSEHFADTKEVNRIKERVLKRAKRALLDI